MLLTLQTRSGSRRHEVELTDDELQKYPESLLSEVASCAANGDIDLDAMPDNPIKLLPAPAATITSLYRHGKFDNSTLNDMLSICNNSPAATITRQSEILTYLRLPGAVCNWLPNLTELELQHARIIQLVLRAYARDAVQIMLNLRPFAAGEGENLVLYVINGVPRAANHSSVRATALQVYQLLPEEPDPIMPDVGIEYLLDAWRNLLQCIASKVVNNPMGAKLKYANQENLTGKNVCKRLLETGASGASEGVVLGDLVSWSFETSLVDLDQPLSSHISEELQTACNKAGVLGGCISIEAYIFIDYEVNEYMLSRVPVWFIKWW